MSNELAQHTPAEWKALASSDPGFIDIYGPDGNVLARVRRRWRGAKEQQANACLIAAAPELLLMLKLVAARIDLAQQEAMDAPTPGTYCCGGIHVELKALIAKAERLSHE